MVILVNVILALAAATREVPVINEMLHNACDCVSTSKRLDALTP